MSALNTPQPENPEDLVEIQGGIAIILDRISRHPKLNDPVVGAMVQSLLADIRALSSDIPQIPYDPTYDDQAHLPKHTLPTQVPAETSSDDPKNIAHDLAKLKSILHHPKLIIIIAIKNGDKIVGYFKQKWQNLLKKLEYKGKIEFKSYKNLKNIPDSKIPIIMMQKMDTHHNIWNKAKIKDRLVMIECSSQTLLLDALATPPSKSR